MIKRTEDQIRNHYETEIELSNKLREAPRELREQLYSSVYDELFRRVPDHPQLARKRNLDFESLQSQLSILDSFLSKDMTFLEIGAGDCNLSLQVAKKVRYVYAVDVSTEVTRREHYPANFSLVICNGFTIPIRQNSIDIAFSNQLIEHLHPDDALSGLRGIYEALVPGGIYICITPNRLSGPHDISKYFDESAKGFHLKEYTSTDLYKLFKMVGFSKVHMMMKVKFLLLRLPIAVVSGLEYGIAKLPFRFRRRITRLLPFSLLINNIKVVATK